MSKTAVLITYNSLPGVPLGRSIVGNVIVYSTDYGRDEHLYKTTLEAEKALQKNPTEFENQQEALKIAAENEANKLSASIIVEDINKADTIFIYVGLRAMDAVFKMAKAIKSLKKNILLIACDCEKAKKAQVASEIESQIHFTKECGGRQTCMAFIEEWNKA